MEKGIPTLNNTSIAIVGLGYVGLPLLVEFSKKYKVYGYDINQKRIKELKNHTDITGEISNNTLKDLKGVTYTENIKPLKDCNVYIVTVPTPVKQDKTPDLSPLKTASHAIGMVLSKGDIVIYESTVYPGITEDVCVPILERTSGLVYNTEFYVGYSPERVNPADKQHTIKDIKKVVSGSTPEIAAYIDELYKSIIVAGTYIASSIRVAEASKIVENIQRDINIAIMNELAIIFRAMDIDTKEVLDAAGTKWNFIPMRPGLVGGHCIGVDPYYLYHKAKEIGIDARLIGTARDINTYMPLFIGAEFLAGMSDRQIPWQNILVMGFSFKENCPDIRNTLVYVFIDLLSKLCKRIDIYDPIVDKDTVYTNYPKIKEENHISLIDKPKLNAYDGIAVLVAHDVFKALGIETIRSYGKKKHLLYDIKYLFDKSQIDIRL